MDEIKQPFTLANKDIHDYLYIGEAMIKPSFRSSARAIEKVLSTTREACKSAWNEVSDFYDG